MERQYEERKFFAAIHGIDVSDKDEKNKGNEEEVLFKDPKEYENMTPEEREELTKRMMSRLPGMFKGRF